MKNKLMLLTAASAFSMAGIAADYTNIVLINLDDVGYGDFSFMELTDIPLRISIRWRRKAFVLRTFW